MNEFNEQQLEDLSTIVVARLKALSPETIISMGSAGSFKRDELIAQVEKRDEIGLRFMEIEWRCLQSLKTGQIYEDIRKYA